MQTNVTFVSSTDRTKLFWLVVVLLLLPVGMAVAQTMPAEAVVIKKPEYELYYMPQYREDGERAARLLDQTVAVAKAKYGTTYRGTPCRVHLYPTPNGKASTGSAMIETSLTGTSSRREVLACTVHLLTWSAQDWRTAGGSVWGDPKDIEYWNALLVNEYITIFHTLTSVEKSTGFTEREAPDWWLQGIEAYDGYYHSTAASLARVRGLMGDGRLGVFNNSTAVYCCERSSGGQGLLAKEMYVDGLALVSFLAHRYGESIHARIMRSQLNTFDEALVQETGQGVDDIFSAYSQWLNSWERPRSISITSPPGFNAATGNVDVSVGGGSGQVQVNFSADRDFTVSINVPWLSFEVTNRGTGTYSYPLRYTANPDRISRTGEVTIKSAGSTATLTITQAGTGAPPPSTGIGPGITITSPAGFNAETGNTDASAGANSGQFQLAFTADDAWTVSVDASWISYEGTSGGRGTYGRPLYYQSNLGTTSRVGVVTIKTATKTATLTITQAGR